jgi:hypothetical protein
MRPTRLFILATVSCIALENPAPAQSDKPTAEAVEVYVWGQQPTSAATEQTRWQKDLELRPSNTPSEVMRLTPGLIIGQHHGGAKRIRFFFEASMPTTAPISPSSSMAFR